MREPISDHDIERLLAGATPAGRPELADVASSIARFRNAAHAVAPQPSAALLDRLGREAVGSVSATGTALAHANTDTAAMDGVRQPEPRGIKKMLEWIAGLGLAAKIAAGTGALALGLTGMGAAGALPGPLQEAFDDAVTAVVEGESAEGILEDDVTEEAPMEEGETVEETAPTGADEFSSWVQEGARSEDKVGAEFGDAVSEQAQELRSEQSPATPTPPAAATPPVAPAPPVTPGAPEETEVGGADTAPIPTDAPERGSRP